MVDTVGTLLSASRRALSDADNPIFDVVGELHRHYESVVDDNKSFTRRVERMPISLYL
ncbi:hypothetical protein [Catellatospora sp. TT07R-123]|uniref:hypothetical protein n=1 Tax=Catellatospora sp. TT07R-123 TaxID=2733863 RepID=UPI001FD1B1AE|nr:hypothetical protein [Catellatospora sp. TT07R-123]